MEALGRAYSKGTAARQAGKDQQKAFERALAEEGISRTLRRAFPRKNAPPEEADESGVSYLILGIHKDYVNTIRMIRADHEVLGVAEAKRDAHEIYFDNPAVALQIPNVIQKATQEAAGDNDTFMSILLEHAARLRILGPETD